MSRQGASLAGAGSPERGASLMRSGRLSGVPHCIHQRELLPSYASNGLIGSIASHLVI